MYMDFDFLPPNYTVMDVMLENVFFLYKKPP